MRIKKKKQRGIRTDRKKKRKEKEQHRRDKRPKLRRRRGLCATVRARLRRSPTDAKQGERDPGKPRAPPRHTSTTHTHIHTSTVLPHVIPGGLSARSLGVRRSTWHAQRGCGCSIRCRPARQCRQQCERGRCLLRSAHHDLCRRVRAAVCGTDDAAHTVEPAAVATWRYDGFL